MENTRERILEVATHLFLTKGYEGTRLSDIINGLNGLTKGAVYHHFESKDAIFNEVVTIIGLQQKAAFDQIKNANDLTGLEKIQAIISLAMNNEAMTTIVEMSPKLLDSPKLFTSSFKQIQDLTIPTYLEPIIAEGMADGSIQTDSSQYLAEILALLLNIWLNPLIFPQDQQEFTTKLTFLNTCLNPFGIDLHF